MECHPRFWYDAQTVSHERHGRGTRLVARLGRQHHHTMRGRLPSLDSVDTIVQKAESRETRARTSHVRRGGLRTSQQKRITHGVNTLRVHPRLRLHRDRGGVGESGVERRAPIFRDRRFDASKPIVPPSWVRTQALAFLTDQDQLTLNHCRAFSYAHLNGNYEEFIPLHLTGIVQQDWHDDRAHLRALLALWGRGNEASAAVPTHRDRASSTPAGIPLVGILTRTKPECTAFTNAVLAYPPLPRFLLLLAFEFGTRRHYVESIQEQTEASGDPLYVEVLKAHWLEEDAACQIRHARDRAVGEAS